MQETKTVRFELQGPEESLAKMTEELSSAPTYRMVITPPDDDSQRIRISGITSDSAKLSADTADEFILKKTSIQAQLSSTKGLGDGSPVNRYTFIKTLGEGGVGTVYEMLDHNMQRSVAIKVLKDDSSAEEIESFVREGTLASQLEHPNIIPLYDINADSEGTVYVSMKNVEGASLASRINSPEPIHFEEAVLIFLKVCDALSYAHNRGETHQDVKPDNIMVGEFGEVFLIDWGSSSASGNEMQVSPVYMSPQQAEGLPPSADDDIYCLGASLFHVLTDRFPTSAKNIEELWDRKVAGEIDPFTAEEEEAIPRPLAAIVLKALAADPAHRYRKVSDMREDLLNFQSGNRVSAYDEPLHEKAIRMYTNNRRTCNATGLVLSLLAILCIWFITNVQRSENARLKAEAFATQQETEKLKALALAQQREDERREAWHTVVETDFSDTQELSPDWRANGEPEFKKGGLSFGHFSAMNSLFWQTPIGAEQKIELEYLCETPVGLRIFITCSKEGDGPLVAIGNTIALFEREGVDERMIASSPSTSRDIFHYDAPNRVVLLQRGSHYILTINGERVLDYHHVTGYRETDQVYFGISRTFAFSQCYLRSLRVSSRVIPDYVKSLEIGKQLIRNGNQAEARSFFERFVKHSPDSRLVPEALLLQSRCAGSLAEERDLLQQVIAADDGILKAKALHRAAQWAAKDGDLPTALKLSRDAIEIDPQMGTVFAISGHLKEPLEALPIDDRRRRVKEILKLAEQSQVNFWNLNLVDIMGGELELLEGTTLTDLWFGGSQLEDISPLRELPLRSLSLSGTMVTDLSPLKGKHLRRLNLSKTPVADLSPLQGNHFDVLYLDRCPNLDLSTLTGFDARLLSLNNTQIADPTALASMTPSILRVNGCGIKTLDFVRGKRYLNLRLSNNIITDLSPLAEADMRSLEISNNQVSDLSPLEGRKVYLLSIEGNPISDLTPLEQVPLVHLRIDRTKVSDLSPLKNIPTLRDLAVGEMPLSKDDFSIISQLKLRSLSLSNTPKNLELVMLCRDLEFYNGFPVKFARPIFVDLQPALEGKQLSSRSIMRLRRLGTQGPGGKDILMLPVKMDHQTALSFAKKLQATLVTEGSQADQAHLGEYMRGIRGPWSQCWIIPKSQDASTPTKNGERFQFRPNRVGTGNSGVAPFVPRDDNEALVRRLVVVEWR